MAGPIIAGSSANEACNNRVKSATFNFSILNAAGVFTTLTYLGNTLASDTKVTLSGTTGTLLAPAITFPVAAGAGAAGAGVLNIEIRDANASAFLGAIGAMTSSAGTPGACAATTATGGVVANSTTGGVYCSIRLSGVSNGTTDTNTFSVTVQWL